MRAFARAAAVFAAIGLALYGLLYWGAERLVERTAHANPFHKIATRGDADWVILGASHAMPLDFGGFNARMERETGLAIVNLAAPGTGPLYNRFVLEEYLRRNHTRNVLYVADGFTFYSRAWNEDRFADAKLLRRTPFAGSIMARLWRYAVEDGVDLRAVLDYASGFSKVNNRERLERDAWEGEAQFERVQRPSASAIAKRVAYLYPDGTDSIRLARYMEELAKLVIEAQANGARVVVVRMPLPAAFRSKLPDEDAFDGALRAMLARREVPLLDFSASVSDPRLFFDTDHLNRDGLVAFFARDLRAVLELAPPANGSRTASR